LAAVRSDHECFGCGDDNPIGLHLRFATNADTVTAAFLPKDVHQGFQGVVHGGIIATVLDEAMAWATAAAGNWAVTTKLDVRFRRPLHVGEPTTVSARVVSVRGRAITAAAELVRDVDQSPIATATATYSRVSKETESDWPFRYLTEPFAAKD
jgi:uncharacterized protein (TIGR00369 family)